jgi:hypothetical protein
LKLEGFFPVALHLGAHVFDVLSDVVEIWHVSPCGIERPHRTKNINQAAGIGACQLEPHNAEEIDLP